MKTKQRKLMLVALVIVMLLSAMSGIVMAASTTIQANTSSAQNLTIKKEVTNVTDPVTATFTYKIEADASNPAAVTNIPGNFTIVFNNQAPSGGKVEKTTTLSLAGLTFTELGDYKFKISEISSSDEAKYPHDVTNEYYAYVSVRNVLDANNTPTGAIEATLVSKVKNHDTGNKMDALFTTAPYTHITVSKAVTGNMALLDEYFRFEVDVKGLPTGTTLTIAGQDASVKYGTGTVTTSTVYTEGQTNYVYLKHGQTVTIGLNGTAEQIPAGTKFEIKEAPNDYETYINGSTTDNKNTGEKTASNDPTKNVSSYVNNKESNVLTGVFFNILPFIALIVLAFFGFIIIKRTSRKEETA